MLNGGCEAYIADLFDRAGTPIRPAYRIRDPATIAKIVGQGLAVSVVSSMSAQREEDDVAVRPISPPAGRELAAFWPKRRKTIAARAVVNAVESVVTGMPKARPAALGSWL